MIKTKRISSKKKPLEIGSVKAELAKLNSSISIAMGVLATLSLKPHSLWIKKYKSTDPQHLRILLQEVMDEISIADQAMTNLSQMLEKRYQGICLL